MLLACARKKKTALRATGRAGGLSGPRVEDGEGWETRQLPLEPGAASPRTARVIVWENQTLA